MSPTGLFWGMASNRKGKTIDRNVSYNRDRLDHAHVWRDEQVDAAMPAELNYGTTVILILVLILSCEDCTQNYSKLHECEGVIHNALPCLLMGMNDH